MADASHRADGYVETTDQPLPIMTGTRPHFRRCPLCLWRGLSILSWNEHLETHHLCSDCGRYCHPKSRHVCTAAGARQGHVDSGEQVDESVFFESSRANLGVMKTYTHEFHTILVDIEQGFTLLENGIANLLKRLLEIHGPINLTFYVLVLMEKLDDDLRRDTIHFPSKTHALHVEDEIDETVLMCCSDIVKNKNKYTNEASNWRIVNLISMEIRMGELHLLERLRPQGPLPMPAILGKKFGHILFRNIDNKCFHYCIAASVFWTEEAKCFEANKDPKELRRLKNWATWSPYLCRLDFTAVADGVDIYGNLREFEEKNSLAVNVLSHVGSKIVLIRPTKMKEYKSVITLFLIYSPDKTRSHFAWIRDVDKFLGHVNPKRKTFFCEYCLRHFPSETAKAGHTKGCGKDIIYQFPPLGQKLKFTRMELTLPYVYTLYYDWETYSVPVEEPSAKRGRTTTVKSEFKPAAFSIAIIYRPDNETVCLYHAEYYDGPNPVRKFFERVYELAKQVLIQIRNVNNKVQPSAEIMQRHEAVTHCEFCTRKFDNEGDDTLVDDTHYPDYDTYEPELDAADFAQMYELSDGEQEKEEETDRREGSVVKKRTRVVKTYHHLHTTGEYAATICSLCNTKVKYKYELPCICHNSTSFDMHLLVSSMEQCTDLFDPEEISVLAKSSEQIIQVEMVARDLFVPPLVHRYGAKEWDCQSSFMNRGRRRVRLRFIDSCLFLKSSLSELARNCQRENDSYLSLVQESLPFLTKNRNVTEEDVKLLFAKLPFPYSYLTGPEVLQPEVAVPSMRHFNNELTDEKCTTEQYSKILQVCDRFDVKSFAEYTKLYCLLDSLLLAVCFEAFRRDGLKSYGLDPVYCCTMPGYSWQCFLFTTKAEVEYIRDRKMIEFLTSNLRGGIAQACSKFAKANNEYSPVPFDSSKERVHIASFDKTSLYSYCLCKPLPVSDYEWVPEEELIELDWSDPNLVEKTDRSYIVEVTLEYPPDVQERTVQLPLMPHKACVNINELSDRQLSLIQSLGSRGKSFTTQPKLLLTCYDREKYGVHIDTLQFYLSMGIIIRQVHRAIRFRQQDYLREYIEYNVEQRKYAKSTSHKNLLKLANNSCFGKCLQSSKNQFQIKFVGSKAKALTYLASSRLKAFKPISENISIVVMRPKKIIMNHIIQTGFTVLDYAKIVFYEGIYRELMPTFGNRVQLMTVDTDGAVVKVSDPDATFHKDLVNNRKWFDFSKLPASHPIFSEFSHIPHLRENNSGVSGLWKLENSSIIECVSLKAKQYSLLYYEDAEVTGEKTIRTDMKCKGITKASMQRYVTHDTYKKAVFDDSFRFHVDINLIKSVNHRLYNVTVNKLGYHPLDCYRVYNNPNDPNDSYPFGYFKFRK